MHISSELYVFKKHKNMLGKVKFVVHRTYIFKMEAMQTGKTESGHTCRRP